MTGPQFVYPEQRDNETGAAYSERIRAMGLPYEWQRSKVVPPGPIRIDYEWSTRDTAGIGWLARDEREARQRLVFYPECCYTLHRRTRWTAVSDWQEVTDA